MRQLQNVILIIIFIFIIYSCGSLTRNTVMIDPGFTKQQVVDILGTPENRQFNDRREAWQYCETDAGFGYDDYVVIWFYDAKVTGITTYKNSGFGPCSAYFRTVNWRDAPDKTIEIRHK